MTKGTRKTRCPPHFLRTLGKERCSRSSSAFFAFLRCLWQLMVQFLYMRTVHQQGQMALNTKMVHWEAQQMGQCLWTWSKSGCINISGTTKPGWVNLSSIACWPARLKIRGFYNMKSFKARILYDLYGQSVSAGSKAEATFHRWRAQVTAPSINYQATQIPLELIEHFVKRLGLGETFNAVCLSLSWWPVLWPVKK